MSAIAGIIHFDERPVSEDDLKRMMAALRYWGPDDEGIWRHENVGLCYLQRKISPEDEFDRQPWVAAESGVVLTASARLDNRTELFERLRIPHSERASLPDSALIVRSYEKWGEACPEHLLGEFAFALWDGTARRLFCARDHLGKIPFHYHEGLSSFAFSTQPKGLFALAEVSRRLDETLLMLSFFGGVREGPDTSLFRDIRRLPAAHSLSIAISEKKSRLREYWNLDNPPSLSYPSDEDYYERFQELFFETVRCRLRTNYPVGILLSGGLDSAAVACAAARILKEDNKMLTAFSFVPLKDLAGPLPPGRIGDESWYIEAVRMQEENIEVIYDRAESFSINDQLDSIFWSLEAPPNINFWIFKLLEQAQMRRVRTMLTGQMGNLSISFNGLGYHTELFRGGRWITLWHELSQSYLQGGKRPWRFLLRELLKLISIPRRPRSFQKVRESFYHPAFLSRTDVRRQLRIAKTIPEARSTVDVLSRVWDNRRKNRRSEKWSAMAAPFGMHSTDPAADKRLVEFCLAVPGRIFAQKGRDRLLVRRGLVDVVPPLIQERSDRGLQSCDLFFRMRDQMEALEQILAKTQASTTVTGLLDIGELRSRLSKISAPTRMNEHIELSDLMTAIMYGKFLLWNETVCL